MVIEEVEFVRGLQARNETAVESFLERYRSLLFHCIGNFERDPAGRDDLYQELVLYTLERLDADRFDANKGSLGTWLYRVAWCRCVDIKRRGQGSRPTRTASPGDIIPDRPDTSPGPGDQAGVSEIGTLVRRALVQLEGEERSLLDLRFVQEQTLGEISGQLGISHEQCKYRLKQASTALRRVLLNDFSLEKMADAEGYLQKNANS
ncbi:MAG: RNA polymerase sigma factor (sigma-70 family) [Planctomycetota bacterium]|jgi:RNA polymerase sigma factor (sigma-70 family)